MENERIPEVVEKLDLDELKDEIVELIDGKKYGLMRSKLLELNEVDIAETLEEINDRMGLEKEILVFRMLPKDVSVDVFAYLPEDDQIDIINGITQSEINQIVQESAFDDMIDILEELPANLVDRILMNTPKEERKLINTFLNYPENSAGSLMTIDYISFRENMTVDEAIQHIREVGLDSETVYTGYVMDDSRHLIGVVSLRSMLVVDGQTPVSEVMHDENILSVTVKTDQEDVSKEFKRYGLLALPVVDNENRLVGIITVDDIFDVIDDEATEDFQRMAALSGRADEEYLDKSVFSHIMSRLPWLIALMCSYIVTGGIITRFQDMLSSMICLVTYMPMLSGTGGNSGSQSSTLIIRGLATEEIELRDAAKVLWKELRVSFCIGIVLSILNMVRVMLLDGNGFMVGLTVSLSMIVIIIVAKLTGSMLPILAKVIGLDPAIMAGPLVSSLTDLVSTLIYFVLATQILQL